MASDGSLLSLDEPSSVWWRRGHLRSDTGELPSAFVPMGAGGEVVAVFGDGLYAGMGESSWKRLSAGIFRNLSGPFGAAFIVRNAEGTLLCGDIDRHTLAPCGISDVGTIGFGCRNEPVIVVKSNREVLAGSWSEHGLRWRTLTVAPEELPAISAGCNDAGDVSSILGVPYFSGSMPTWTPLAGWSKRVSTLPPGFLEAPSIVREADRWLVGSLKVLLSVGDGAEIQEIPGTSTSRVDQFLPTRSGDWLATSAGPFFRPLNGDWIPKRKGLDQFRDDTAWDGLLESRGEILLSGPVQRWRLDQWEMLSFTTGGSLATCGDDLLAGSGGVRRSTDGGSSWAPSSTGLPPRVVISALHRSGTGTRVLAGGNGSRVYSSEDCGLTWTALAPLDVFFFAVTGVETASWNPRWIAAWSRAMGLFLSSDGGQSWRRDETAPEFSGPGAVVVDQGRVGIVYQHAEGRLWKSRDAGTTWVALRASPEPIVGRTLTIDEKDPRRLYVGTNRGLWRFDQSVPLARRLLILGRDELQIQGEGFEEGVKVWLGGVAVLPNGVQRVNDRILVVRAPIGGGTARLEVVAENPSLERTVSTLVIESQPLER